MHSEVNEGIRDVKRIFPDVGVASSRRTQDRRGESRTSRPALGTADVEVCDGFGQTLKEPDDCPRVCSVERARDRFVLYVGKRDNELMYDPVAVQIPVRSVSAGYKRILLHGKIEDVGRDSRFGKYVNDVALEFDLFHEAVILRRDRRRSGGSGSGSRIRPRSYRRARTLR